LLACDPLSFISHKSKAATQGRKIAAKLKEVLSRQQFEIVLQARIGTKVLARERIAPYRKDVLATGKGTVCLQSWIHDVHDKSYRSLFRWLEAEM
jgi:translation elongation factor EF-4